MSIKNPVYVTSPLLPPLADFLPYLDAIWQNKWLTNNGPFHQQLEQALQEYLGCRFISLFTNGTMALLCAIRALELTGEVITTPYSFVATSHSLIWNGLTPVFVDINPLTGNLDPEKIEQAITPRTSAIMPVHCYGIPADVEAINSLAKKRGLKVIYDAAHAFGVRKNGVSVLNQGDFSILSFHATKVFNTFEGGAVICPDAESKKRIDHLKNFGFSDETHVDAIGINGKMNEIQAAFGLLQLQHIDRALMQRKAIYQRYQQALASVAGLGTIAPEPQLSWNYAYFPLFVRAGFPCSRDALYQRLKREGIMVRRYFYPLISEFPAYAGYQSAQAENLPVAQRMAREVLCLPLYADLTQQEQQRVIDVILSVSGNQRETR